MKLSVYFKSALLTLLVLPAFSNEELSSSIEVTPTEQTVDSPLTPAASNGEIAGLLFSEEESSDCWYAPSFSSQQKADPLLEAKLGYFFFTDSTMNQIYDWGGMDVQLSASYPIWRWLSLYASVEYLEKNGHTTISSDPVSLYGIPVSLGLKPTFWITPSLRYYITGGPRYFYISAHLHSPYLDRHVRDSGIGGFVNTGFIFYPVTNEPLFVDFFAEYSCGTIHFKAHKANVYGLTAQVGGVTIGGGLGYTF